MIEPKTIVLMGVSGSGKTTIGRALSQTLGYSFFDADDFHPKKNIDKMSSGLSLNDQDRLPWIGRLNDLLCQKQDQGLILACSALKESYRQRLSEGLEIDWFYLKGSYELILQRLENRSHHFMPHKLLKSQFDTLEEPDYAIAIAIDKPIEKIIEHIKNHL